ncbi:MAG: two-component regulator propeller domain-containing protein [Nitrospiria bacterium]
MRSHVLSFIILTCYLSGCIASPTTRPTPPKTRFPPRFINFETGANIKSLAFEGRFLWLGLSNGMIRYDTGTPDQYQVYTTRSTHGLLSNGIYKIAVDADGIKWVGTYGGGLSRFDGTVWTTFTPYGGGKIDYDASWVIYPNGTGLGDLWVYDIFFDTDASAWIATWKGLSHFDGASFVTYTESDGLLDKWVYAIAKDRNGLYWFGTEGGLNSFDGTRWKGYTHRDGLGAAFGQKSLDASSEDYPDAGHHEQRNKGNRMGNPNYVLDIAVDRQNVKWIATYGTGLTRFDGRSWTNYTAGHGTIGGNFVKVVEIDPEGNLWAGTDGGVTRFDGTTWTTYTTADGLLHNDVFSIAFDDKGNKWFGTWIGLSKMID